MFDKEKNYEECKKKYIKILEIEDKTYFDRLKEMIMKGYDGAEDNLRSCANALLINYCNWNAHTSSFLMSTVGILKGNFNHHHNSAVRNMLSKYNRSGFLCGLKRQKGGTLEGMLKYLRRELLEAKIPLNPDGELTKRIGFIQYVAEIEVIKIDDFTNPTKFNELCETELSKTKKIQLQFRMDVKFGNAPFVTGTHSNLGNWKQARRMKLQEGSNDHWVFELDYDEDLMFSNFNFLLGSYDLGETPTINKDNFATEKYASHKVVELDLEPFVMNEKNFDFTKDKPNLESHDNNMSANTLTYTP